MAKDGLQVGELTVPASSAAVAVVRALEGSPGAPTAPDHGRLYPTGKSVPEGYWAGGAGHELGYWRRRAETAEARIRVLMGELEAARREAARRASDCIHPADDNGVCKYGCGDPRPAP